MSGRYSRASGHALQRVRAGMQPPYWRFQPGKARRQDDDARNFLQVHVGNILTNLREHHENSTGMRPHMLQRIQSRAATRLDTQGQAGTGCASRPGAMRRGQGAPAQGGTSSCAPAAGGASAPLPMRRKPMISRRSSSSARNMARNCARAPGSARRRAAPSMRAHAQAHRRARKRGALGMHFCARRARGPRPDQRVRHVTVFAGAGTARQPAAEREQEHSAPTAVVQKSRSRSMLQEKAP